MKEVNMPELLTPDMVQAVAANADTLKSVLSSGDEKMAMGQGHCQVCCCPKLLKFKFVLCNVTIINENADCAD